MIREYKNLPIIGGTCLLSAITFFGGYIVGVNTGKDLMTPKTIYEHKIAGDKRDFFYVKPNNQRGIPFVRIGPTEFRRLDDVAREQNDLNNQQNKSIEAKMIQSLNNKDIR